MKDTGNWFDVSELADTGEALPEEFFENIVAGNNGFRVERIVSDGQASPEGFWYEQQQAEWVIVLQGEAGVQFEDEEDERLLQAGDYLLINAMRRHRVSWTSVTEKTIWLAIFFEV